ncbi:hypothetical protein QLX08_003240 [Tetragonisca angustula]|uniref:Uncharacterized protein n=1 Tax=Tetragonisca angustula TaxID=166442 RepID=A0AAW1A9Y2_9HYME
MLISKSFIKEQERSVSTDDITEHSAIVTQIRIGKERHGREGTFQNLDLDRLYRGSSLTIAVDDCVFPSDRQKERRSIPCS